MSKIYSRNLRETKKRPRRVWDVFDLKSMLLEKQLPSCCKEIGISCKMFPIVLHFDYNYIYETSNCILAKYFANSHFKIFHAFSVRKTMEHFHIEKLFFYPLRAKPQKMVKHTKTSCFSVSDQFLPFVLKGLRISKRAEEISQLLFSFFDSQLHLNFLGNKTSSWSHNATH